MSKMSVAEIGMYQARVSLFAQMVLTFDASEIEQYLAQTASLEDGTLDAVIPHFMSIGDMRKGQETLRFLREMGRLILEAQRLVGEQARREQA